MRLAPFIVVLFCATHGHASKLSSTIQLPCRFDLEVTNTANLRSLVGKTETVFIYIKLNFLNTTFDHHRYQYLQNTTDVINAGYWVWSRGTKGRFLLGAPFDFKIISSGTLSIGTEQTAIDIRILPENETSCFNQSSDTLKLHAISKLLLNITNITENTSKDFNPIYVCLERQFDRLEWIVSSTIFLSGLQAIVTSMSYYDCWETADKVEPFHVFKYYWDDKLRWCAAAVHWYLPLILLHVILWKKPPRQVNGNQERLPLDTDLIPIGPVYWMFHTQYQSSVDSVIRSKLLVNVICRWMPIVCLLSFLPFLRPCVSLFMPEQLYLDRIEAYKSESELWSTPLKWTTLTFAMTIVSIILFLMLAYDYVCTSERLKELHFWDPVTLVKLILYDRLSTEDRLKDAFKHDHDKQNVSSLVSMYTRLVQSTTVAYHPVKFWRVIQPDKNSIFVQSIIKVRGIIGQFKQRRSCSSLLSVIFTVSTFPFAFLLFLAIYIPLWLLVWCSISMPFVTIAFWPVYFRKYQTKTIAYVIVFVKYIMFLYVFFVAGFLTTLVNIISLTEFISFTFIGMIVNSSDVLPYCSVIIVVFGYIVYNTAQLYDEYHQLYQTVFKLGLEIDKDKKFPKRVVEHDTDGTLTIETDLFLKIVERYKPVFRSYTIRAATRYLPIGVVAYTFWKVLKTIGTLNEFVHTVEIFSVVFITGSISSFAYLFRNPTLTACQTMTRKSKIKEDLIWYCTYGKLKPITLWDVESGTDEYNEEIEQLPLVPNELNELGGLNIND